MLSNYIERVKAATNNPVELSRIHLELAYEFARESDDYERYVGDIVRKKRALMEENKTVAKAEQAYELSEEGMWERKVRIRLKAYEKLLSGLKQRIASYEAEARNQY